MIGYLEGTLLNRYEDRILLLTNKIGYEVVLPAFVMNSVNDKSRGDEISLFIYYCQTERQPKPVLIGFNNEDEKIFFQKFIAVEDMGPMKAVKAMSLPIHQMAAFIEDKNTEGLQQLKGIGKRTAMKIVAALSGTMGQFTVTNAQDGPKAQTPPDFAEPVIEVMVNRLGLKLVEARKMVADALKRNPQISTPEELFDDVYRT